jgi:hypothetical protein
MTTDDLITALRVAIWRNNIDFTASLLDKLEARLGPATLADMLEDMLGEGPPPERGDSAAPLPVACA